VHVPVLEVGGYWDQEDMWGTQAEYAALKQHDAAHQVFLVLGPWKHGEWQNDDSRLGSSLGGLEFAEPTGTEFRATMEAPFFEKYLKDRPGFDLRDTASFRTGVNRWERYDRWPPATGYSAASLYLEPGRALSFTAPAGVGDGVAATYVSDPADPVPYRHRPIQSTYAWGSRWSTWLVEDQRFVTGRKDVATFTMPALDNDVTITGDVVADLFAATTGSDADWVVKLIDVYPDEVAGQAAMGGYQLMVSADVFRGRYRESLETPKPISAGQPFEYRFALPTANHVFLPGHRMMVQIQSSWFPLYDRNPQTFVPSIFWAQPGDYQRAVQRIYHTPTQASFIELPLVTTP
jgi:uncharacterized protein